MPESTGAYGSRPEERNASTTALGAGADRTIREQSDRFRTPSSRAIQCDAGSHTVSLRRHLRAVITLEPLTTSTILSRESLRLTLPPDDTFLPGRLSQRASRHRMVTTMSTSCGPPTSWSARDEWRRTRQHSR
jgi:hypothetical protein